MQFRYKGPPFVNLLNIKKKLCIKQHAETIHSRDTQILGCNVNIYTKKLFLESWHSTLGSRVINERKALLKLPTASAWMQLRTFHALMKVDQEADENLANKRGSV